MGVTYLNYPRMGTWEWWELVEFRGRLTVRVGDGSIPFIQPDPRGIRWMAHKGKDWVLLVENYYSRWMPPARRPYIAHEYVQIMSKELEKIMARITGSSKVEGEQNIPENTPVLATLLDVEVTWRPKYMQPDEKEQILNLKWAVGNEWIWDSPLISMKDSNKSGASRLKRFINALRGVHHTERSFFDNETFEYGAGDDGPVDGRVKPGIQILITGEYRPRKNGDGLRFNIDRYSHPSDVLKVESNASRPSVSTDARAASIEEQAEVVTPKDMAEKVFAPAAAAQAAKKSDDEDW